MNESVIYKTVIDKDYEKTKYLLSSLLKIIYNMLREGDTIGVSSKFTSIVDAIFFFLNNNNNVSYLGWYDYSLLLNNSLLERDDTFPTILITNFKRISGFNLSSPIVAQHSNETLLLKIVEKLIKKCDFKNDRDDGHNGGTDDSKMETNDEETITDTCNENLVKALQVLSQPMVKYGLIGKIPDANEVVSQNFLMNITSFATVIETNFMAIKNISSMVPLDNRDYDTVLVLSELLKFIGVHTFNELGNYFKSFYDTLKISEIKNLKVKIEQWSSYEEDIYMVGQVVVAQFDIHNINYIDTSSSDKHRFYLETLNTYARHYVISEVESICKNEAERGRCKANERYFIETLQSLTESDDRESLVSFKRNLTKLINNSDGGEEEELSMFVNILKDFLELSGEINVSDASAQVKLLVETCGSIKLKAIVQTLKSFSVKFGLESFNFIQDLEAIKKVLSLILPNKNIIECENQLKALISASGVSGSLHEVYTAVSEIKNVYIRYFPDETFRITDVPRALTSFIKSNNTDAYEHIPGETISEKLMNVQEKVFHRLELSYSDFTDVLVEKFKDYDKVSADLVGCREALQNCRALELDINKKDRERDDLIAEIDRLKKEHSKSSDLESKIKELNNTLESDRDSIERITKENLKLRQDLNSLKSNYDGLQTSYDNMLKLYTEMTKQSGRNIAIVSGRIRGVKRMKPDHHEDDSDTTSTT